ncbi:DNA-binding response regulator [Fulvitalea axinellae]|uniref:DNA-binding response regulator n=1 Tax=Fulvitalea axinellae TaxID=1182444 RepID=A0AAU9D2H2_9BACT|nr:DNA-binding response regulator [Fulvitalea axinellae]
MDKIKTIVVEDERLLRVLLVEYIEKTPQLELVGNFKNALEALEFLNREQVDLMFLDIQMPHLTGVEFLESLSVKPLTVFTTAYSEYAVKGFELGVVDYLLKPIVFPRFMQTVNKVIQILKNKNEEKETPEAGNEKKYPYVFSNPEYISVKANHRHYKIHYEDILYLESLKEYVVFHTVNGDITALASLKKLEDRLPENQFVRTHKSFVVSIRHIQSLYGNELTVGDHSVPVGASFRSKVLGIFEKGDRC